MATHSPSSYCFGLGFIPVLIGLEIFRGHSATILAQIGPTGSLPEYLDAKKPHNLSRIEFCVKREHHAQLLLLLNIGLSHRTQWNEYSPVPNIVFDAKWASKTEFNLHSARSVWPWRTRSENVQFPLPLCLINFSITSLEKKYLLFRKEKNNFVFLF